MKYINIYTIVFAIFLLWVLYSDDEHFGATNCNGKSIANGSCNNECIINYPYKGGSRCANFTPSNDCNAYNNGSCHITDGTGMTLCEDGPTGPTGPNLGKCIPYL